MKAKKKKFCCQQLDRQKSEIDNYIKQLIESQDDFDKTKWAWGIIKTIDLFQEAKNSKKRQNALCPKCKSYLVARRRVAELIILGSKS